MPASITTAPTESPPPDAAGHRGGPASASAALTTLGVFSTATAAVVYFRLIASAGPSFTSQLNYLIPLWALGLGILFLGESPSANHLYALGLILTGVLIAATRRRSRAA